MKWDKQDSAVALGAACYGHQLWGEKTPASAPTQPQPSLLPQPAEKSTPFDKASIIEAASPICTDEPMEIIFEDAKLPPRVIPVQGHANKLQQVKASLSEPVEVGVVLIVLMLTFLLICLVGLFFLVHLTRQSKQRLRSSSYAAEMQMKAESRLGRSIHDQEVPT